MALYKYVNIYYYYYYLNYKSFKNKIKLDILNLSSKY